MENSIYIKGEIGNEELDPVTGKAKGYTYNQALLDYQRLKDVPVIDIFIASPGGYLDEAIQIADLFQKSGKLIRTFNVGNVASAAVNLFLIPDDIQNRNYDPTKGKILIHYPWIQIEGNADELAEFSKTLKTQESELVRDLKSKLNVDEEVLRGYMKQERFLTDEEVESLNIGKIVTPTFKAVAKLKKQNMNEVEIKKELGTIKTMFEEVKALFKKKETKALMIQDVNGAEIDLPDIETVEQLKPDLTINVDGQPGEGEFVLEDGTTIVCAGGKVTEIIPKEEDELAALKTENESLKAEIETLKGNVEASTQKVTEIQSEFDQFKTQAETKITEISQAHENFKKKFSKDFIPDGGADGDDKEKTGNRSAFKKKE